MGNRMVEVVTSKRCSRLGVGFSSLHSHKPMSPASFSVGSEPEEVRFGAPFSGLVICVTGLSKEARKQVMEATERLGGHYSPNLNPKCTHLVVQNFGGRKFEHALKHGCKNGLFIVALGWFVDSVRKNARLSESLYNIKSLGENGVHSDELNRLAGFTAAENSCLPVGTRSSKQCITVGEQHLQVSGRESNKSIDSSLSGCSIYVDLDISAEVKNKVINAAGGEGATFIDKWFVGCGASHIVCEGSSAGRYLGHCSNLVTPLWILKTAKDNHVRRLVHMSADLARQVNLMLEDVKTGIAGEVLKGRIAPDTIPRSKTNLEERQQIVNSAKVGVRNRRSHHMQTCQIPIRPITPGSLLESICWSVSEPTSNATLYTDSFSSEDVTEYPAFFYAKDGKDTEASFANLTRSLTESEKTELVFKNIFLTILFPVDRFAEMGPSSRTYFSDTGFTCLQVLDEIYAFYQENMSNNEIEAAIHTDSRHGDSLRSVFCTKETAESGYVIFKRIDFLGSRKSFEMLKRVSGDNNSNVYELLIRG